MVGAETERKKTYREEWNSTEEGRHSREGKLNPISRW